MRRTGRRPAIRALGEAVVLALGVAGLVALPQTSTAATAVGRRSGPGP